MVGAADEAVPDGVVDAVVDGAGELDVEEADDDVVLGAVEADVVAGAVVVSVTVVGVDDGERPDPVPLLPPSTEKPLSPPEIGAPLTASTTVTAPIALAKTAADTAEPTSNQRSRPGRDHQPVRLGSAAGLLIGTDRAACWISTCRVTAVSSTVSASSAGEPAPDRTCCTVRVTVRRVRSREWPITALPTTETTEAIAAPTMVPATPSCAPMNAATTAADMLATTWVEVRANLGASAVSSAPV